MSRVFRHKKVGEMIYEQKYETRIDTAELEGSLAKVQRKEEKGLTLKI